MKETGEPVRTTREPHLWEPLPTDPNSAWAFCKTCGAGFPLTPAQEALCHDCRRHKEYLGAIVRELRMLVQLTEKVMKELCVLRKLK